LRTVLGDMRDLSVFVDPSFDLVFNPVSNLFVPELAPVWRECFRVLRPGGVLLCGLLNPDVYLFDHEAMDQRGELVVRHRLPYSDLTHVPAEERERLWGADAPLEYSHTLAEQIGGQLAAGFVLTGFSEAPHQADATAAWLTGYFATRGHQAVLTVRLGHHPTDSAEDASRITTRPCSRIRWEGEPRVALVMRVRGASTRKPA
jgi:SAM-dependent methyltransferase